MAVPVGKIAAGTLVIVVSFAGAALIMNLLSPGGEVRQPVLVEVPPLQPLSRNSVIVTPTAIALTAIRDAMEQAAPKNLTGKRADPAPQLLSGAEIGWDITRGPLTVTGRPDALSVSTPLNGTLRATGQFSNRAGDLSGLIGNLLNQNSRGSKENSLDQRAEIRGNITMTSRPEIVPSWRIEPNLTAQVSLSDAGLSIMGFRLNLAQEIKPLLDRNVNEQVSELQAKVRDDPFLETIARREWTKMCRSLPLGRAAAGMPDLWLEIRPTRAFAAQPRTDETALTLTVGVQAETRIVPAETKPSCPFPAQLEIVPQLEQGRVNLAVPIDVPFTELNRLLEAQLKGKTFPDDRRGALAVNVRGVSVAASGDRLLIALRVKANETRSWFGLGAEATIYVWGRPVLDSDAPDASPRRYRARCRIAGGIRYSGGGGAGDRAVSGAGGGRKRRRRPSSAGAERPPEHRDGNCRFSSGRRRRAGRCGRHGAAVGRCRVRRQDTARDRRSRRHRTRGGHGFAIAIGFLRKWIISISASSRSAAAIGACACAPSAPCRTTAWRD